MLTPARMPAAAGTGIVKIMKVSQVTWNEYVRKADADADRTGAQLVSFNKVSILIVEEQVQPKSGEVRSILDVKGGRIRCN